MSRSRLPRAEVRHGRPHRTAASTIGAMLRLLGIAAAVLLVSTVSLTAILLHSLNDDVASHAIALRAPRSQPQPPQPLTGSFNVLLVGADNAPDQRGFGEARQSTQNDVDILLHVAADHRSAVVLSLPRDLIVDHPACVADDGAKVQADDQDALNVDLNRGGLSCVVTTVQALTGLSIPYAAEFTFQGTIAMADAVGGVPVCTTAAIDDPDSGLVLPKGRSIVSGRTALAYLRDRHGVGDGSDLARISSQQAYMSSLLRQAVSARTLTDPTRLIALASATAHNVSLSTSMAKPDVLVGMMVALLQVPLPDLALVQLPTEPYAPNPNKVAPEPALTATLLQHLRDDTPVVLAAGTHGYATSTRPASTTPRPSSTTTATPSTSPTPRASPATSAISGLSGQTADESSCSEAAAG